LDAPVLSAYVWRGQVLNNEAVLQPSLTMTKGAFSLCPSVSVGVGFGTDQYNKGYFGVNKAAFNDLTFTGSVGCTLANNLTLSPMVQYVALLDGEIRDAAQSRYQDDCQVVGSVKLTYTF
jgi:outer membrane scaffolding protein for murein synthesis (MipA/OmpV family)